MSWSLVQSVPLPDRVAGHPALDFCNTRAGWNSGPAKEYLTDPFALRLWVAHAGLVPARGTAATDRAAAPALSRDGLGTALDLRDATYRCALGRATTADWDLVAHCATSAHGAALLRPSAPQAAAADRRPARWSVPVGSRDAALHIVALAVEDLLTSPVSYTVAACPGTACGWLFCDPRRRRRWCSMAVCGNRAKARRHADRAATGLAPGGGRPTGRS